MTLGAAFDVTDKFTVSGDVTHVSGYYSDDLNTDDLKTEAYTLANLQASYRADFGGTFFAYVNNVADIDAATSCPSPGAAAQRPRRWLRRANSASACATISDRGDLCQSEGPGFPGPFARRGRRSQDRFRQRTRAPIEISATPPGVFAIRPNRSPTRRPRPTALPPITLRPMAVAMIGAWLRSMARDRPETGQAEAPRRC